MSKNATGGGMSAIWVQGLACGAAATLMPITAALVAALLALMLDRQAGRPIARAMLLYGVAAAAAPLRQMWDTPQGIEASLSAVASVATLGVAWLSAGMGWFLAELAPVAVHVVLDANSNARAARLRLARETLLEDWGKTLTDR